MLLLLLFICKLGLVFLFVRGSGKEFEREKMNLSSTCFCEILFSIVRVLIFVFIVKRLSFFFGFRRFVNWFLFKGDLIRYKSLFFL